MASTSVTPLLDLAESISNAALTLTRGQLQAHAKAPSLHHSVVKDIPNGNGQPVNGTDSHAPASAPSKEVLLAKAQLLHAVSDLTILALGPAFFLRTLAWGYHDTTALSVIVEFGIQNAVPLEGDISYKELAGKVGLDAIRVERILRLLFTKRIFHEPRPGYVAHTAISAELSTNKDLAAFLGHCWGEAFPAAGKLQEALRKHPYTEEPNETGFNLAFGTTDPLFSWFGKHPDRFDRFNQGMAGISQSGSRSAQEVIGGYDWGSLGTGTVVDVGGGNGHISIALAEAYPTLNLVVQDLPDAVRAGAALLPASLSSTSPPRVAFEAHDMFQPNPQVGAKAFYLRHILHDWPDSHAILILKALVPALRNGARVLVADTVIPPPGELGEGDERFVRSLDLQMLVLHNARERTEEDFKGIFAKVDSRFRVDKVWRAGTSVTASTVVEASFVDE